MRNIKTEIEETTTALEQAIQQLIWLDSRIGEPVELADPTGIILDKSVKIDNSYRFEKMSMVAHRIGVYCQFLSENTDSHR